MFNLFPLNAARGIESIPFSPSETHEMLHGNQILHILVDGLLCTLYVPNELFRTHYHYCHHCGSFPIALMFH